MFTFSKGTNVLLFILAVLFRQDDISLIKSYRQSNIFSYAVTDRGLVKMRKRMRNGSTKRNG
jgi:hypothetical protein